jgi:hypothetical protein
LTEFILIWNGQAETSLNVEQWKIMYKCFFLFHIAD